MTLGRIAAFVAVLAVISGGLHYYLWARLVRDPALSAPWGRVATVAMIAFGALTVCGFFLARVLPRRIASAVMWIDYSWMGLAFFLLLMLVLGDVVRLVGHVLPLGGDPSDPSRRLFLSRLVGGWAAIGATSSAGLGVASALGRVAVKRVPVAIARLDASLEGYTIVQLSDVHVGPTIGRDFVEQLVSTVNALDADLVVITGDLVDGSVADLRDAVAPLADLRARDGVYFVTGNHEYYSGADEWLAFLPTLGIRPLRNERVPLGGDRGLDLAGVDDYTAHQFGRGHGMDVRRAMEGRDVTRPVVLLAHQPKAIDEAAALGVDLQLSGHTHGGQIWPFGHLVKLVQPFVSSLHARGATQIYVSCGTGYWGPPMRLAAPAEITRIELRRPAA